MKKLPLAGLIVAATVISGTAYAANYVTICEACSPFTPTSASVLNAAITLAQQNSAQVGDNLDVCKDGQNGISHNIGYSVNSAPVTSSSNLTYTGSEQDDSPCE